MVDRPKIDQIISNCREYVQSLARLRDMDRDAFLGDPDAVASAKYHFVIAIEACTDAANHIVSSEGYRLPKDNADTFRVLAENEIVTPDRLPALIAMARFRNRLVHLYWNVDNALVREYLETRLADFESFLGEISGFILTQTHD
jgi:uncharacterized protein YutE (UPF0331/DUF86 family)